MFQIRYDKVLRDGLPNWKSALYYYRHYRKMGLMEMCALLFIIITVCQYIVAWAAYAEKKYTAVCANNFDNSLESDKIHFLAFIGIIVWFKAA